MHVGSIAILYIYSIPYDFCFSYHPASSQEDPTVLQLQQKLEAAMKTIEGLKSPATTVTPPARATATPPQSAPKTSPPNKPPIESTPSPDVPLLQSFFHECVV